VSFIRIGFGVGVFCIGACLPANRFPDFFNVVTFCPCSNSDFRFVLSPRCFPLFAEGPRCMACFFCFPLMLCSRFVLASSPPTLFPPGNFVVLLTTHFCYRGSLGWPLGPPSARQIQGEVFYGDVFFPSTSSSLSEETRTPLCFFLSHYVDFLAR